MLWISLNKIFKYLGLILILVIENSLGLPWIFLWLILQIQDQKKNESKFIIFMIILSLIVSSILQISWGGSLLFLTLSMYIYQMNLKNSKNIFFYRNFLPILISVLYIFLAKNMTLSILLFIQIPGAFMGILIITKLNQLIKKRKINYFYIKNLKDTL